MAHVTVLITALLTLWSTGKGQEMETISGTIYCDNSWRFWINGEFIDEDPFLTIPHNAHNVTFQVRPGEDITFAIEAIDFANQSTGLELDNHCIGDGGLRAMFSNGVVTNSEWKCYTYLYGPVNWRQCFAAARNASQALFPACRDEAPPLDGCYARLTDIPQGWTQPDFDESYWEYALEYPNWTDWGLLPTGCDNPDTYISSDVDPNGMNVTCPSNLDWGETETIWREDLDLDNWLLCRYTLKLSDSGTVAMHEGLLQLTVMTVIGAVLGTMCV